MNSPAFPRLLAALSAIVLAACASVEEETAQRENLAKVHFEEGEDHYRAGNFEAARDAFTRAIEVHPGGFAEAYYRRGNCRFQEGQDLEALADYTEAMKLSPGFDRALYNRGETFRRMGRWREALDDFQAFHRNNPSNVQALKRIGSLLYEHVPAKRYEALEFLRRYLQLVGRDEVVERWVADLESEVARSGSPPGR